MCAYSQSYHTLPHWKYLLRCCSKYSCVNLPDQGTGYQYSDTSLSILFHIYLLIACCATHGRIPLNDKKHCRMCKQDSASEKSTRIYTRKELGMMETNISNFYTSFYIPEIQKLAFHIPHVQILGTNNCGDSHQTPFKRRKWFQDVLCLHGYAERVVASFSHQLQAGYYGGNISVSIEVIKLEHFSALPKTGINASTKSCPLHAVFHFFSDSSKQDAATPTSHS